MGPAGGWGEANVVFLGANGFSGSLYLHCFVLGPGVCLGCWEARRGGGAEECKVKNVQFETGLEGRRRRNLQMFSLSFFKLRSTYIQGVHRSSVYGLVNCYLRMHLCNRQFLEARVHAVMCIWPKDGIYIPTVSAGRNSEEMELSELSANLVPITREKDEYSRILISLCIIYILLSLDWRCPPPSPPPLPQ